MQGLDGLHMGCHGTLALKMSYVNWMGQFGNNVQSAINGVCPRMFKRSHRHGI